MSNRRLMVLCLAVILVFSFGSMASAKAKTSVWIGWPDLLPAYQEAVADFEAETGNKVEVLAFPLREFERKLAVSVPAGNAPDIFVTSDRIPPREAGFVSEPPKSVSEFIADHLIMTLKLIRSTVNLWSSTIGIALSYWNKII